MLPVLETVDEMGHVTQLKNVTKVVEEPKDLVPKVMAFAVSVSKPTIESLNFDQVMEASLNLGGQIVIDKILIARA